MKQAPAKSLASSRHICTTRLKQFETRSKKVEARQDRVMIETMSEHVRNTLACVDTLDQTDAEAAVGTLVDRIIAVLRRDRRMPAFTYDNWQLLFADDAARSRDDLGQLIEDKVDVAAAAEKIIKALVKASKPSRSQRRVRAEATT
jgi:hypothetical protein